MNRCTLRASDFGTWSGSMADIVQCLSRFRSRISDSGKSSNLVGVTKQSGNCRAEPPSLRWSACLAGLGGLPRAVVFSTGQCGAAVDAA
jgi:hypothetical protein